MRKLSGPPLPGGVCSALRLAALGMALLAAGCGGGGSNSAAGGDLGGEGSPPVDTPVTGTPITVTTYAGRGWFVDSAAGSDSNAGTAAAPWKTLERAARQSLAAGDALLLKCGGYWQESLTLDASNAGAGSVTLGIWGTCTTDNRPRISGARNVSGVSWTAAGATFAGKPVHVTTWTRPVTRLYWNSTPLVQARYPNDGGIGREFSLIGEVRNGRTLVPQAADAGALAGIDLTGARAIVRTVPWMVEAHDIASSDTAGAVTLRELAQHPLEAGEGYFVEGKLALLDVAGEWFHDAATGQLYVWTPDGSAPAADALQSVERNVGVSISNVSDVTIDNIVFERHGQRSIEVSDAPRTRITGVTSRDAGHTGISIDGASAARSAGSSVLRSTVTNAAVMGISVNSADVQVSGNRIDGTGIGAGGTGVAAGIYLNSVGGAVLDNEISNSGYAAVVLTRPTGVTVSGNTLTRACRRFTDCGAIYAGGAPSLPQRSSILANHISGMAANPEGAVGGAASLVAGIYLDEASASQDVLRNMIGRASVGINLHNSSNHLVQENVVWLSERASVRVHDSSLTDMVRGNVIQDNRLYASSHLAAPETGAAPTSHLVYAQQWQHHSDAAALFAGANPNIVRRNTATTMTAPERVRWSLLSGTQHRTLDAGQWSALAAQESIAGSLRARPFIVTAGDGNLIDNGALQSTGEGWTFLPGAPASTGSTAFGACGAGCAELSVGHPGDLLISSMFRMSAAEGSNLHRLRVRAQSASPDAALRMAITRASGDEAAIGLVLPDEPVAATAETSIDVLFTATSADAGRLNIAGSVGSRFALREVTVAPVRRYELFEPARESDLLANAGSVSRTFDCPSTVLRTCSVTDLSGGTVQWPVTLAAGTSLVVLSADAKWR